jgi:hypothetical protein
MLSITKYADEILKDEYGFMSIAKTLREEVIKPIGEKDCRKAVCKLWACDFFNSHTYESWRGEELVTVETEIVENGKQISLDFRYGMENCDHVRAINFIDNATLRWGVNKFHETVDYLIQYDEEDNKIGYEITYIISDEEE